MRRQLACASLIAVLGWTSPVFGLGLGDIDTSSALNERFKARIPLRSVEGEDTRNIKVSLASPEAFERAGIERTAYLGRLDFNVKESPDGNLYVEVTSTNPIKEPFLNFLLRLRWPDGQLMREYTVLLDPPTYTDEPARQMADGQTGESGSGRLADDEGRSASGSAETSAAASSRTEQAAARQPSSGRSGSDGSGGNYGPVAANETLYRIANRVRPDSVSTNQAMMALLRANPQAFIGNNINRLREGANLKVPDRSAMSELSAREATRRVEEQIAAWRAQRDEQVASAEDEAGQQDAEATTSGGASAGEDASGGELDIVSPEDGEGADPQTSPSEGGEAAGSETVSRLRSEIDTLEEEKASLESENEDLKQTVESLKEDLARAKAASSDGGSAVEIETQQPEGAQEVASDSEPAADGSEPSGTTGEPGQAADTSDTGGSESPTDGDDLASDSEPTMDGSEPSGATGEPGQAADTSDTGGSESPMDGDDLASDSEPAADGSEPSGATGESGQAADTSDTGESESPTDGDDLASSDDMAGADASEGAAESDQQGADAASEGNEPAADEKAGDEAAGDDDVVFEDDEPSVAEPAQEETAASADGADQGSGAEGTEPSGGLLSTLMDNIRAIGLTILGILLAVVGILFYVRRRSSQDEDELAPSTRIPSMEEAPAGEMPTGEHTGDPSGAAVSGESDPMAQADAHIESGELAAAQDVLDAALGTNPEDKELRHKLLKVLAERGDRGGFEAEAQVLHTQLDNESDPLWQSTVAIGKDIAPEHPLFSDAAETAPAGEYSAAAPEPGAYEPDTGERGAAAEPDSDTDFDLSFDLDEPVQASGTEDAAPDAAEPASGAAPAGADEADSFDLDFGGTETAAGGGEDMESFDLDLGDVEAASASEPSESQPTASSDTGGDDTSLDFDLDLGGSGESAPEPAAEEPKAAQSGDETSLDFDLEFGDDETPSETSDTPAGGETAATDSSDTSGDFDLADDLDLSFGDESSDSAPSGDSSSASTAVAGEETEAPAAGGGADELDDMDEVATKLDLAQAYLDMGDPEGAKGLLTEVVDEGDESQRQQAQELLEKAG